jgi:hypothetical protein
MRTAPIATVSAALFGCVHVPVHFTGQETADWLVLLSEHVDRSVLFSYAGNADAHGCFVRTAETFSRPHRTYEIEASCHDETIAVFQTDGNVSVACEKPTTIKQCDTLLLMITDPPNHGAE